MGILYCEAIRSWSLNRKFWKCSLNQNCSTIFAGENSFRWWIIRLPMFSLWNIKNNHNGVNFKLCNSHRSFCFRPFLSNNSVSNCSIVHFNWANNRHRSRRFACSRIYRSDYIHSLGNWYHIISCLKKRRMGWSMAWKLPWYCSW
jgi:hypothetical protein